jgi:hypothetical protein
MSSLLSGLVWIQLLDAANSRGWLTLMMVFLFNELIGLDTSDNRTHYNLLNIGDLVDNL